MLDADAVVPLLSTPRVAYDPNATPVPVLH